jgi:hypothetical protein
MAVLEEAEPIELFWLGIFEEGPSVIFDPGSWSERLSCL